MDDIYENIEKNNPAKECKIMVVFDERIFDTLSSNKLKTIVTELFIRGKKLNVCLISIRQPYFVVPKIIRLNSK